MRRKARRAEFLAISLICLLIGVAFLASLNAIATESKGNPITDSEKQQLVLNMVNAHRNDGGTAWPAEVILAMICQEGGEGAFHTSGDYYSYNNYMYGPWTEPDNTWQSRKNIGYDFFSDGIMQVTPASGYAGQSGHNYYGYEYDSEGNLLYRHFYAYDGQEFGGYTNDQEGYEAGVEDGIAYLDANYASYAGYINAIVHYNTGPATLWIYKNGMGDPQYLGHIADKLSTCVPSLYGFSNQPWVDALEAGQQIVDDMLAELPEGESVHFYKDYQKVLDWRLRNIILFDDMHDTDNDELTGNYLKLKTAVENARYRIVELNTDSLTYDYMKPYGILILPDVEKGLSESEVRGLIEYLNSGRRLLIIGEWKGAHLPESVTEISEVADIEFEDTFLGDPDDYYQSENWVIINNIDTSHEIGKGVSEFAMYAGSSLKLFENAVAIARGDDNTYTMDPSGNGTAPDNEVTGIPPTELAGQSLPYGTEIVTLASSKFSVAGGEARLVCIADSDLWKTESWEWVGYDPIENYDNKRLLVNIINWLATPIPPPSTPPPGFGVITHGETHTSTITIVEGAPELRVELTWLGSDLDLGVEDPLGKYVGYNPDTGQIEIEIPGAQYSGLYAKPEWVSIPNPEPGEWIINVYGREIPEAYELYRVDVPDTFPPAPVADLSISDQMLDSVTLNWTAPGDDGNIGTATTYDIRYSTSPINEANWDMATQCIGEPAPQPAGNPESLLVTNILPRTDYYFALKTADEVPNWSEVSNIAYLKYVDIDVLPCQFQNQIRVCGRFVAPYLQVAIPTTSDFNASMVDPSTVRFGPGKAKPLSWYLFDLRCPRDFERDLILTFRVADTGLQPGDTEGVLTGETYDGTPFVGTDSVRVLPCTPTPTPTPTPTAPPYVPPYVPPTTPTPTPVFPFPWLHH